MRYLATLFTICSLFSSVATYAKTQHLTQGKLVEVLVDLELTQVIVHQAYSNNPELVQAVLQEQVKLVFSAHHIDQTLFQQSYLYYLSIPQQFRTIQEQLIDRLKQLLKESQERRE
jgi:hypothetical protein